MSDKLLGSEDEGETKDIETTEIYKLFGPYVEKSVSDDIKIKHFAVPKKMITEYRKC